MEYHFDRKVILSQDSKHKSLYKWSLQEIDANDKKLGRDLIPWVWSFTFRASELLLSDTLAFENRYKDGSREKEMISEDRRFILAKLAPERQRGQFGNLTFSMFGTGRTIKRFELHIKKLENENEPERCMTWGCVSYTSEVDFRNETTEDCLVFMMYLSPRRFAAYADKISSSAVDEIFLRVTGVSGLYSDWSPGISTDHVKVLTGGSEHEVAIPDECDINPPRLGDVNEAQVYFRSNCVLRKETLKEDDDASEDEEKTGVEPQGTPEDVQAIHGLSAIVGKSAKTLSSMRMAAWLVCILLIILIFKH